MRHWKAPLFAAMTAAFATNAPAETLYGLTAGNSLAKFDSATPGMTTTSLITGLQTGESLLGIDFRPADGQLYGLGSSNRLYVIDTVTATATVAGSGPGNDPFGPPSLTGMRFAFDFNPAADRIRVVGDDGQNIRLNQLTGGVAGTDSDLDPTKQIVGAAYDRNDIDPATPTTLFVIDAVTDSLYLQGGVSGTPSPNGGLLTLIGALGVDTDGFVSFDISSATGTAYATLTPAGTFGSALFSINLATGAATILGQTGLLLNGVSVAPVPLPAPVWMLGSALLATFARARKRAGTG